MTIFVTGAAGFIGFHESLHLLEQGHEVVGFDNFVPYYSVELKEARWAQLEQHTNFTGVRGDLCDLDRLQATFAEHRFDRVCHLAAQAGVRYSLENPQAYMQTNLSGFGNILECCRHAEIPRLVYASSSSVYGTNKKLPFSESDNVDNPISLYAATKKSNELLAHCYTHLYGMQTVGLRFFTVYGPWGRPDMALWMFTEDMLAGKPIKVFNHGKMRRDFTWIGDIVQGVTASLFTEDLDAYEIFNLGNHRSEDLMNFINILAEALGVTPEMELLPMQPGDVPATYADIGRAQAKLGFSPSTPISAGLPKFAAWYRSYFEV